MDINDGGLKIHPNLRDGSNGVDHNFKSSKNT